jgi:hypothetical protein
VRETGTAQAVSPPHSTSKDAGGDLDAVLASDGARRRTRMALSSADAEEISTDGLALRLGLGRRAPVRATATPTNKDCDVTRRAPGSRSRLVAVPAHNALFASHPRAGSASCVRTRPQARLLALARAPVPTKFLAFSDLHTAARAHGSLTHAVTMLTASYIRVRPALATLRPPMTLCQSRTRRTRGAARGAQRSNVHSSTPCASSVIYAG